MTSYFRRAGQEITRLIRIAPGAPLPGAETDRVIGYGRSVGGVPQFFARSPDFARQVSGTGCNIFDKPLVPHALDDEFDSTALAAAWSTVAGGPLNNGGINPYAVPVTYRYELHTQRRPSWLMTQIPNPGTLVLAKDITAISGGGADFFVWARGSCNLRSTSIVNNDGTVGIELSTAAWDANNRVIMAIDESDASSFSAEFAEFEGGVPTTIANTANMFGTDVRSGLQPIEAVGIQKIGTTYHGWAFNRVGSAIYMGSTVFAPAIGTVAIRFDTASGAAPGTPVTGIDFVRFKASTTFLP